MNHSHNTSDKSNRGFDEFDRFSKMIVTIILSVLLATCVFGGWIVYALVTWITGK